MEKILKTIDALKMPSLSSSDANIPGTITSAVVAASDSVKTKKKERINHCRAVTDAVCTSGVQSLVDFNKILESVVEVLFQLCDDPDSDIRLVASDCLNRIARILKDTLQPKFHMEVYKEIRKNQSARSLRTAFNMFAFICPSLRPLKHRAFLSSLLPCFSQVSKRTEELLYENFSSSFAIIFEQLGPYAHDSEIKILCKEFLSNLESTSAIIRRASASVLVSICKYSKKPEVFLPKLLSQVSELLMPNLMEKSVSIIIGVLLCIRQCIPVIYEKNIGGLCQSSPEEESLILNLLKVYEMCMILCNHDDHNVITTSLETLQQLFTNPIESIVFKLTSPEGIKNSLDDKQWTFCHGQDHSMLGASNESLTFTDEAANLLEADLDVPKFRSLVSSTASDIHELGEVEPSIHSSRRGSDVFVIEGTLSESGNDAESIFDEMHHSDEDVGLIKPEKNVIIQSFPELQIGSLYEQNCPIYYCARFLAYNFLLTGQTGNIRPDGEVRTSVKVLATNCIISLIEISPEIFNLPLSPVPTDSGDATDVQKISDVCLYSSHLDPLLRGSVYILVGVYMKSESLSRLKVIDSKPPSTVSLLEILKLGLADSSNVGVKCALLGVTKCLRTLLRSTDGKKYGNILLTEVVQCSVNPYWLVKVDLIELLSTIEWDCFESSSMTPQKVLDILIGFLSDEDPRVRSISAAAFIKFLKKYSTSEDLYSDVFCKDCVMNEVNINRSLVMSRRNVKCIRCEEPSGVGSFQALELVLSKLLPKLNSAEDKFTTAGYFSTLALISESYKPEVFASQWKNVDKIGRFNFTLQSLIETIRTSPHVYDSAIHQSLLCLTGNLFMASDFYPTGSDKEKSIDDSNPFRCCNVEAANHGVQLLQHCIAIIKVYQNILENTSPVSALRRQSSSPVISPVKKFSQKLEAEKKSQDAESEKKARGVSFSDTVVQSHFKKISESIHQSWKVYKSNLDSSISSKFTSLLATSLAVFSKLFSVIRPDYSGMSSLIDEVLGATASIFHLCPVPVLKCIQEMLKCIFSGYNPDFLDKETYLPTKGCNVEEFLSFMTSYENILVENRAKSSSKSVSDKSSLGKYIRQFESAVVTALRIYTTSGCVEIQAEVLHLLSQLVKGHVNYGLVDSSQVFLGYVLKQVASLEDGYLRNGELLAQEIFLFLTLLTHEQSSSKKFVDISKVLRVSDGLISASERLPHVGRLVIPGFKIAMNDVFIYLGSGSYSNLEKIEHETQRAAALEMVQKLMSFPEILPTLWIMLKGRKISNESKWNEDSRTIISAVVDKLQNREMLVRSKPLLNNLIAVLYCASIEAVPSQEVILSELLKNLSVTNDTYENFLNWCVLTNAYWTLLTKQVLEGNENEIISSFSSNLILGLLESFFSGFRSVVQAFTTQTEYFVELISCFIQITKFLLKSEKLGFLRKDMRAEVTIRRWISVSAEAFNLQVFDPCLHQNIVELLATLLYPHIEVWKEAILKPASVLPSSRTSYYILTIIRELNEADVSSLEEWVIVHFSEVVLRRMNNSDVALFLNRLSTYRMEQILDQITILLGSDSLDVVLGRCLLKYLEKVSDTFLCETAVLGMQLMQKINDPFLSLEISQFVCTILSHIRTRKMLVSNRDREVYKRFLTDSRVQNKHQRLVILASKILAEDPSMYLQASRQYDNPILQWCCEEVNQMEGIALSKMLSTLKYSYVMTIFNKPGFNLSLLRHCFNHLRNIHTMGTIASDEIIDLFSSQKRSTLIDKWPLAVAAVEFIVETLDEWENTFDEPSTGLQDSAFVDSLATNIEFKYSLCRMWSVLTEMLKLKSEAMKIGNFDETDCCNNFIPTKIFTLSFQYMASKCQASDKEQFPFEEMLVFLDFASVAVCDPSFLNFFDVRDNPPHIFTCISSLESIVSSIMNCLDINYVFCSTGSELNGEMNEECVRVLQEFQRLTDFVQRVQLERYRMDCRLLKSLKSVVAGLGRCELINGWVLISHLGWRPQVLSKSQIFPPIQQIPLEILRNETDMLLKYINKLNLLGVASKIQFEENWVIFLSVINLYVDENFQLQIVSTGLRALSMMLRQSIKVTYTPSYKSDSMKMAATKIEMALADFEPGSCGNIKLTPLICKSARHLDNIHSIDVNSCIRFLTDLYSQWLQNPQGKMPLFLLSEVIHSIVVLSEYFDDQSQYSWMYETLVEIYKSCEREDEVLWPHLMYGICFAGSKLTLDPDGSALISTIIESSIINPTINVSQAGIKSALVVLQNNPENVTILNIVAPFLLKSTQLDEITNQSESQCCAVWNLLLFSWIYCSKEGATIQDFEHEIVRNILTVLSPLNKVYVSVRLLVLEALRIKVHMGDLKPDIKKTISKVSVETLRTPNLAIFVETLKLYLTIFYADFNDYLDVLDPDPEVLMPMAERLEILFQQLKSNVKCNAQIVSKVLPMLIIDFLPPSEILNRVIAEFMSPMQTCPELMAPVVAQVFEKARRRPREAALVREWILASLPNFVANADISRTMWSLTLFFIGVSTSPDVACLLPFSQLRRRWTQIKELFLHSALDFYSTLEDNQKNEFKNLFTSAGSTAAGSEKRPYSFLINHLDRQDLDRDKWAIDRIST